MVAAADVAVALLPLCAGACASAALMMPATAAQPLDPFRFAGRAAPGMEWFKEAKLGLFMHWGPVSQWGAEISFPLVCNSLPCHPAGPATCGERRCLLNITTTEQLAAHRQAYADLATTWDPVEFDARKMARLAKAAGFKYLIYTTVHCDGFVNWPSNLTNYSIAHSAWGKRGRGTFSELVTAFRAEGLRVGAYVCPSLWNNNDYWAPNALTATGQACTPNYAPAAEPERWHRFTSFLHGLISELISLYQPDAFWFDCVNSPPNTDTHLEALIQTMRAANPNVVINVRDGLFSDYIGASDNSESVANSLLGVGSEFAGEYFEVPSSLSEGQWTYGEGYGQRSTKSIISNLMLLTARNGNYLMNIPPDATGVWCNGYLQTMAELADWMAINGEAIHGSTPAWPYQDPLPLYHGSQLYTVASNTAYYVLIPSLVPAVGGKRGESAQRMSAAMQGAGLVTPVPTGGQLPAYSGPTAMLKDSNVSKTERSHGWEINPLHTAVMTAVLQSTKLSTSPMLRLQWMRPSLFKRPLHAIYLLTNDTSNSIGTALQFTQTDEEGLTIDGVWPPPPPPPPPFNCATLFNCSCADMGRYYAVGPACLNPSPTTGCPSATFGCAPPAAQAWWRAKGCKTNAYYNATTDKTHRGCSPPHGGSGGGGGGGRATAKELGLVLKFMFSAP